MSSARLLLIISACLLTSCTDEPAPPALTEVIIDTVSSAEHQPSFNLVGRLHAFEDVEIKANVSGYLKERMFTEGDHIKKGTVLFQIDPSTYKAELAGANAELARALATQKVAQQNYLRGKELLPKGALSASEMDKLTGSKLQADADIKRVEALVKAANVNLSYTKILAPIDGQIGDSRYSAGDLINPNSEALTTIVDVDPIKVIFQISESSFIDVSNKRKELTRQGRDIPEITVGLQLSTGDIYPLKGAVDYISNRVDQATGTIEGRALIPNPSGVLKPGQYVTVLFEVQKTSNVLMVPQMAIQADQQGSFALVVTQENKVVRRNLVLGKRDNDKVIVKQGITEGENIIIRGLQQVRSGQQVTTKHINTATPSTDAQ